MYFEDGALRASDRLDVRKEGKNPVRAIDFQLEHPDR